MTLRSIAPWLVCALALGLLSTSCGDPDDPDCFLLCRNYSECVRGIDVDACTTACEFEAGIFEQEARQCERCIEGLSCLDQASCWAPRGDCVDFVAFVARNGRFELDDDDNDNNLEEDENDDDADGD